MQELLVERPVDLLAQPAHQHVNDVGLRIEAVFPHVRQNHRLRHDAAGVANQVFEQRELPRPQVQRFPSAGDAPRQQIQHQVLNRQRRRFRRAGRATNQRLDPGQQFGECERFGEVVVAASLKAADAVVHASSSAENQDRRRDTAAPQLLDDRQSITLGEHHVHDGDVVGLA
jgi:hypothetical protein